MLTPQTKTTRILEHRPFAMQLSPMMHPLLSSLHKGPRADHQEQPHQGRPQGERQELEGRLGLGVLQRPWQPQQPQEATDTL